MEIIINNEQIETIVKEQTEIAVRKRLKEMQGSYTSKGYLEDLIKDIIWNNIYTIVPDLQEYIENEIKRCINNSLKEGKITKQQLVDTVVENLLNELISR